MPLDRLVSIQMGNTGKFLTEKHPDPEHMWSASHMMLQLTGVSLPQFTPAEILLIILSFFMNPLHNSD